MFLKAEEDIVTPVIDSLKNYDHTLHIFSFDTTTDGNVHLDGNSDNSNFVNSDVDARFNILQ